MRSATEPKICHRLGDVDFVSKGGEMINFSEIGLENGSAFGVKRSILGDRVEELGSGSRTARAGRLDHFPRCLFEVYLEDRAQCRPGSSRSPSWMA